MATRILPKFSKHSMSWTALGVLVTAAGVLIAFLQYVDQSQKQQVPSIRIESAVLMPELTPGNDGIPRSVRIGLTNVGDGLAENIDIRAWVFMVKTDNFRVPSDEELRRPDYTAYLRSLMTGEATSVNAIRSMNSLKENLIPAFDGNAVPLIKVTVTYQDTFENQLVERSVMAGAPAGYEVSGYDHEPQ